jgi:hypothetical protein
VSLNQPDLDLLADYVGGALDGTPEEERVGERIRSDAEWAAAYSELVTAFDSVSTDLRAFGQAPEPMPADVWDRLEAALSAPATASSNGGLPSAPPVFTAPRDNRPAGRAARRRRRVHTPVLAAIAVLVVLTIGIFAVKGMSGQFGTQNSGSADTAAPAAAGPPIYQRSSGRDYTDDNLVLATDFGNMGTALSSQPQSEGLTDKSSRVTTSSSYASPIPSPLQPLTVGDRLARCLEAVTAIMPGQVLGVDYAAYQGTAAALVVVRTPDDGRWVGVVGADCGNKGADLLAQKRLS